MMPIQNIFAQRAMGMPQAQAPGQMPTPMPSAPMPGAPMPGAMPVNQNFMLARAMPPGGAAANPPLMPPVANPMPGNPGQGGYAVHNMMPPVTPPMSTGQNFMRMRLGF